MINYVLEPCQNLLVIDSELGQCQFSHFSIQEYFENYHWTFSEANGFIGKFCPSLLNYDPVAHKTAIIKVLLERGADVNVSCGYYFSVLRAGSIYGHSQVVQLLLDN